MMTQGNGESNLGTVSVPERRILFDGKVTSECKPNSFLKYNALLNCAAVVVSFCATMSAANAQKGA